MYLRNAVIAGILGLPVVTAWAHGDNHAKKAAAKPAHVNAEEHAFGRAGDPRKAAQTIRVGMDDSMHFAVTASARPDRASDAGSGGGARFAPGDIVVKRGETIRFVVRNDGKAMHEMVIGTMKELKEHAELMRKFPGMEHDEPYMAHVAPGREGEIVWQFTRAGEFHYACLVPGHMEAGMIAKIVVVP